MAAYTQTVTSATTTITGNTKVLFKGAIQAKKFLSLEWWRGLGTGKIIAKWLNL